MTYDGMDWKGKVMNTEELLKQSIEIQKKTLKAQQIIIGILLILIAGIIVGGIVKVFAKKCSTWNIPHGTCRPVVIVPRGTITSQPVCRHDIQQNHRAGFSVHQPGFLPPA